MGIADSLYLGKFQLLSQGFATHSGHKEAEEERDNDVLFNWNIFLPLLVGKGIPFFYLVWMRAPEGLFVLFYLADKLWVTDLLTTKGWLWQV